jgi:hypothetical protein
MACLLIAAWTSIVAFVALSDRPGWALVFAGIAGFALGVELMVVFYEDSRRRSLPQDFPRKPSLKLVHHRAGRGRQRRSNEALAAAPGDNTATAPRSGRT